MPCCGGNKQAQRRPSPTTEQYAVTYPDGSRTFHKTKLQARAANASKGNNGYISKVS